LFIVEDNF